MKKAETVAARSASLSFILRARFEVSAMRAAMAPYAIGGNALKTAQLPKSRPGIASATSTSGG